MTDAALSEVARAEQASRRMRILKDRLFGWTMAVGGISVIAALLTIFLYLLWVVLPLFRPASLTAQPAALQFPADPQHLSLNEYGEVAFSVGADGSYRFVDLADGSVLKEGQVLSQGTALVPGLQGYRTHGLIALGLQDGRVSLVKPAYRNTFKKDRRGVEVSLARPFGEEPISPLPKGALLKALAVGGSGDTVTVAAASVQGDLAMAHLAPASGLALDPDSVTMETTVLPLGKLETAPSFLLVNDDQQLLVAVSRTGVADAFDIRDKEAPRRLNAVQLVPEGVDVTDVRLLAGGHSLLVGDSQGTIAQWFLVRENGGASQLIRIREFKAFDQPVARLEPEYFRKAFVAVDARGRLGLFHTTAERTLLTEPSGQDQVAALAIAPRGAVLLAVTPTGAGKRWTVDNRHPEVSWHSLWERVWYEGREHPEFIWQSSSATSDFEPKFSLTPLVFGTLKAAFYALFFAIPVALMGAIYTAYFMHPRLRSVIKPSIEIMAALPTVILGFLAGLWLAPLIETHLLGVLVATIGLPLGVVLLSGLWSAAPRGVKHLIPPGRELLLILPVLALMLWGMLALSQPLEQAFFDGNLPRWLTRHFGFTYDQRNSLVVGIAMGFAVIPNIFSISEDAIFAVPRQLTTGSLALGATPWQTVSRVVLLTASPGIFSAVMIGLGRAVGETMIVLMSTGNTPVMDWSMFVGFRALSANIAVEMPESEVNSTHYRILFLAALVLFMTTFVFNTVAEIVRQRLRRRYGNL